MTMIHVRSFLETKKTNPQSERLPEHEEKFQSHWMSLVRCHSVRPEPFVIPEFHYLLLPVFHSQFARTFVHR